MEARLRQFHRQDGPSQRLDGHRRADRLRPRRLGPDPHSHRLHSDRRPGLSAGRAATARRRRDGPHQRGLDRRPPISPAKSPASIASSASTGMSLLDNSADLFNAGAAWIMLKPFDERLKAKDQDLLSIYKKLSEAAAPAAGRTGPRAAAARDPGHRQRRRFPDAARTARRQHRLPEARPADRPDRRGGGQGAVAAECADDLPQRGAARDPDGRPRPRPDPARVRSATSSRRSPTMSARPMSTSSTSSASPCRSMSRRIRNSGCIPKIC